MTSQALTPIPLVPNAAGVDLTGALVAATNVNLTFTNSGREFLAVTASSGTPTVTLDVGTTILGQGVTAFSAVTLTTATHVYLFGPFSAQTDASGTSTVTAVLSATSNVTVALLQFTPVV